MMNNLERFFVKFLEISLFILLFLTIFFLANINVKKFFESNDFINNIYLLSAGNIGITKALIYPFFNGLLLPMIEPVTFLLFVWSFIPTILIYLTAHIINKLLKGIAVNRSYLLVIILTCVSAYFSLFQILFRNFVPTGHLLFQSSAAVFFLLALWYWHHNRKYSILFITISFSMHYVVIIYIFMLFIISNIQKKRVTLSKLFGLFLVCIILYYLLILGYSSMRPGSLNSKELSSMGVKDIKTIYVYTLESTLGLILLYFFRVLLDNLIKKKNIDLFLKKIVNLYSYSLLLAVFSWMTSLQYLGLGYRIGYLVYVWTPLLIALMPAISILLIGSILQTNRKKTICFQ